MKILYVLPHFYPHVGGSEQAFMDIITELIKKKNINVRVVTSQSGSLKNKDNYKGIDIFYYNWKIMFGHPLVNPQDLYEHVMWADVVHVGVYSPVIPTLMVCKKFKKPSIVTAHEVLGNKWYWVEKNIFKATLFKMYETLNVKQSCTFYHTPSDATKRDLENCNKKARIKNIYWISDKEITHSKNDIKKFNKYFNLKENDNKIFLCYGRPGKTKGIFVYLNAIKIVVNTLDKKQLKKVKFCFLMANDPMREKQKFINQVQNNNLQNYVIVKDSVNHDEIWNFIECANYVVIPSITEGFGLSAIEACEMGKNLIHSSAGSLPEVTFGNVAEFENRNSQDLANVLIETIRENNLFKYKNKKDFSRKTIGNEFIEMYNEAIEVNKNEIKK